MTASRNPHRPISRVLVIFPGALGDLVCLIPALDAIARRHRDASLELMARAELARFMVGRSVVSRAHSIDAREVGALFTDSHDALAHARTFFSSFDRIYSFFAFDDSRFRANLIAATNGLVSFHPFRPDGPGHVALLYLRSIDETATPDSLLDARIEPTPDDLSAAANALAASSPLAASSRDRRNFIAIFPGSGSPLKNWPAANFAALASTLATSAAVAIILGPAEAPLESFFAPLRACGVSVMTNLELGIVAGMARLSTAFIGNDSGVSHLASATGARGIVIFGATDPSRWAPRGRVTILRRDPIGSLSVAEVTTALNERCSQPG
jgi:heptosyltransferase-3